MSGLYENGKVYKLWSPSTDRIYVGSTILSLQLRFRCHRYLCSRDTTCSAKHLMKYKDVQIALLEAYPCSNREELNIRENYWVKCLREFTVNIKAPYQSKEEKIAYRNEYNLKYRKTKLAYTSWCSSCDCMIRNRALHERSQKHIYNVILNPPVNIIFE